MNKLIGNELNKIFHKKAIWIIWGLILVFCIFNNYIYKTKYNADGTMKNAEVVDNTYYKTSLNAELSGYDPKKASDVDMYVSVKTEYDILVLSEKYSVSSWQYKIINNKFYDLVNEMNNYTYKEKDDTKLKEVTDKYNLYLSYLESDNWKAFADEEKTSIEKSIVDEKKLLEKETNKQNIENINRSINNANKELEIVNYRLDNNISYADSYLNDAINDYKNSLETINDYENNSKHEYEETRRYNKALKELNVSKYIIEKGQNLYQENTLRAGIRDLFDNYQLFIIMITLIIAGTIVSEEYNKGTIKLLLIKPYKRTTILLGKYFTSIIVMILTILFTLGIELLIGGLCFGFDSLSIPVLAFDLTSKSLISYNVFSYLGIVLLAGLPKVILLLTLAFALSTIFGNSVVATTLTLLGFMFADFINQLALSFHLDWMRYFVTPNWNFNEYLFGGLPTFENVNLGFSVVVCLVYFVIMMTVSIIVFKKKNIKNQ